MSKKPVSVTKPAPPPFWNFEGHLPPGVDEDPSCVAEIEEALQQHLRPRTPYERLRAAEIAMVERDKFALHNRRNRVLKLAVRDALRSAVAGLFRRGSPEEQEAQELVQNWAFGSEAERATAQAELEAIGIIMDEVIGAAYLQATLILQQIDRQITQMEARRQRLHKEFRELQALNRTLDAIEDAEIVE